MKRGLVTRRIAWAILVSFAGLLLLALAPLLYHARLGSGDVQGLSVRASQSDTVLIGNPIRLSSMPDITFVGGTISAQPNNNGETRALVLEGATLEFGLAGGENEQRTPSDAIQNMMMPLLERLVALDVDRITLRRCTVVLRWGRNKSATLDGVGAELLPRNKSVVTASGRFSYLGQAVEFDGQAGPGQLRVAGDAPQGPPIGEKAVDADAGRGKRWPLLLNLRSPLLNVNLDGAADIVDAVSFTAQTIVRTPDVARLAEWLGFGWKNSGAGPPLLVKGPARWSNGDIAFGRSQISVSDQESVGAMALSLREGRPIVEATLAFPALDVAPFLHRTAVAVSAEAQRPSRAAAGAKSDAPAAAPTISPPWRNLSTSFPAVAAIDAELRISATRLQWNGTPIGRGAVTLSARAGRLHADLAELDLGTLKGNLQVSLDESGAGAPVSLRGRMESTDIAPIATQLLGIPAVRGRAVSQFDLIGRGATLGQVVDGASGRGSTEVRDGQLMFDLVAAQKLAQSAGQGDPIIGWGTLGAVTALEALDAKFQVRDGTLFLDQIQARSKGLMGAAQGRIGVASSDLDVALRIAPVSAGATGARSGPAKSATPGSRSLPRTPGDLLAIRGSWLSPAISAAETEPAP